jgi:hypothetical protein
MIPKNLVREIEEHISLIWIHFSLHKLKSLKLICLSGPSVIIQLAELHLFTLEIQT